jgi:hypothetical protein
MPKLKFEEAFDRFSIKGWVGMWEGPSTEDWPEQTPPSDIIQLDQSWNIWFWFRTTGDLCNIMCGKWKLQILLEKMGGGETNFSPTEIVDCVCGPHTYIKNIHVPPRKVGEGVYRVIATVRLFGPGGHPGPVAAFVDLGLVQFYED